MGVFLWARYPCKSISILQIRTPQQGLGGSLAYRGTSLNITAPPPQDLREALDIVLLYTEGSCEGAVYYERGAPVGGLWTLTCRTWLAYRGYSELRTRTALGSYGRAMPRSI